MNKKIRKLDRTILLFSMVMVFLCCSGCSNGKEQNNTAEQNVEAGQETSWKDEAVKYRVCLTSDVHFTPLNDAFGWNYEERVQLWVDTILAEHEKEPFDLIIINGDVSLDWRTPGGTMLTLGQSTTLQFIEQYVSQLPEDVPVYIMPGNHEKFTDEVWQELTGNGRAATCVLGDNLFVMPDSFSNHVDMTYDSSGEPETLDVEYIKNAVEEYPNHKVYQIYLRVLLIGQL